MAALVTACQFLQRMRFSLEAANEVITEEGLDNIEGLAELTPKRCERIVDRIIKPGGLDATGQPNCGIRVPEKTTTNLIHAAQLAKMWKCCQRPHGLDAIQTRDQLATARRQMELEEQHKNNEAVIMEYINKDLRERNFYELFEEITETTNKFSHSTGVTVSMALRYQLIPKAHNAYPVTNYMNPDMEAAARHEIVQAVHAGLPASDLEKRKFVRWTSIAIECNNICFDVIQKSLKTTNYFSHVTMKMIRERDGRAAMLAIIGIM